MDFEKMNIQYSSVLSNITEINPSFDTAKLRIAYTGKNRNNSFISKESFERAIPSMYNCPIVANYMREEHEIGSHDVEAVIDGHGDIEYVVKTQPVGIVPESATYSWETVEDDGVIHQYLCTDVLLWKRQEAYQKIKENGITEQSMEISVTDGEIVDGYYNIKDFHFTAFCLLGTAEPCFESAALFTFANSEDEFKQQYTEMMQEFKAEFSSVYINMKEGEEKLNKLQGLLEKYNLTESDLDFEYETLSDEELESRIVEFAEKNIFTPDVSNIKPTSKDKENNFELNQQVEEKIRKILKSVVIEREWGSYQRYYLWDFDLEKSEVYFYDDEDSSFYGCSFSYDNDDIIIDFETKQRKKIKVVDYIEGESNQILTNKEAFSLFDTIYSEQKSEIERLTSEVERLTVFEQEVLNEKREIEEATLFEKFEDKLKNSEEFQNLKSKANDYSLEDLEKELFILVGKMNFTKNDNTSNDKPMIGFETLDKQNEPDDGFGGLFAWMKNKDK